MLSELELRHIIESGFLPLTCACTISPDGLLAIKVYEPGSGRVDLLVTGVCVSNLNSSRALANLIEKLRKAIAARQSSIRDTPGQDSWSKEQFED